MANSNVDWLSAWKSEDFSGKSEQEIKELKEKYNWYVDAYVSGLNSSSNGNANGAESRRTGKKYEVARHYWVSGPSNPNLKFFKVKLKPAPKRTGTGGGPGQITPAPPPPPK